jgi:hypothetical protein
MHVAEHLLIDEHVSGNNSSSGSGTSGDHQGSAITGDGLAQKICELLGKHILFILIIFD